MTSIGAVSLSLDVDGIRASTHFNDLNNSAIPLDKIETLVSPLGSYLTTLTVESVMSTREYFARKKLKLDAA